jgi:three-Cys-motif partner protein
VNPSFDKYIFIENDEIKINELIKVKSEYPDRAMQSIIEQRDANEFIQDYCNSENWKNNRAVLFLDPFATDVDWVTIEAIAKTKSIDVWILFPVMAVNRLLAKDPEKVFSDCLNRIFGTPDWYNYFYKEHSSNVFFGESVDIIKKCDVASIGNIYQERLKD